MHKILLVDDDKEFREEFREFLDAYDVAEASSADEALAILRKPNEIDLVVLDVMMPGLSGTDALTEIKKIDPNLGIIIMTGHSTKDVAIEALKGHADDYVEKIDGITRIKDSIENLLSKLRAQAVMEEGVKAKIEQVKRFVERNCFKKTTLEDAAKAVCLSSKYLSRIFCEITGSTFSSYRLNIKTEAAKELLCRTALTINQISNKLGYENPESFIRQFKTRTGLSPAEFRKKNSRAKNKPAKKTKKRAQRTRRR